MKRTSTRSKGETSKTEDESPRLSPRKRPSPGRLGALRGGHFQKGNDGSRIYRRRSSGGILQEEDATTTTHQDTASPVLRKRPSDDSPATGSGVAKRLRTVHINCSGETVESDAFCWVCHKEAKGVFCEICPRVYHMKCLSAENIQPDWVCPVCEKILQVECVDSQSRAMSLLGLDQLCVLLKYALQRMRHTDSEDFHKPVDPGAVPQYTDYVFHPMDISTLEKNIRKKLYGSTEAFLADARYILHNCVIFNGEQNKLTANAKMIIKICKHEMSEIEICPDCYLNSCTQQQENWFCEPCRHPHTLVWAKMKGYPYWPAKALREIGSQVDVRFFGEHDRAWVSTSQVFLLSVEPPAAVKKGRGGYETSMEELRVHINKLIAKFGGFEYAPHKMLYDAESSHHQIKPTKSRPGPNTPPKRSTPSKPKPSTPAKSPEKQTSIIAKTASAVKLKYNSIISTRHTKERGKTIGDNVILSPTPGKARNKKVYNFSSRPASPLVKSPLPSASSPGLVESVQIPDGPVEGTCSEVKDSATKIKDTASTGESLVTPDSQGNDGSGEVRSPDKTDDPTVGDSTEEMENQEATNSTPLIARQVGDSPKIHSQEVKEKVKEVVTSRETKDPDEVIKTQVSPDKGTECQVTADDPDQVIFPQPTVLPNSTTVGVTSDLKEEDEKASGLVDKGKTADKEDSQEPKSSTPAPIESTEQPAETDQINLEASMSNLPESPEKSSGDKEPSKIFLMTDDKHEEFEVIQPKTDLTSILEMVPKLKSAKTNVAVKIAGKIKQIDEDADTMASSEDQPAENVNERDPTFANKVEDIAEDIGEGNIEGNISSDSKVASSLASDTEIERSIATEAMIVGKIEDRIEVDSRSEDSSGLTIDKPVKDPAVDKILEHGLGVTQSDAEKKNPFLEKLVASCKEKLGVDDEQVVVDPMRHWSVAATDDSETSSSTDDNFGVDSPMSVTSPVPDASDEVSPASDASSTSQDQRASPETIKDSDVSNSGDKDQISDIPKAIKSAKTNETSDDNDSSNNSLAHTKPVTQCMEKVKSDIAPENAASLQPNTDTEATALAVPETGARDKDLPEPEITKDVASPEPETLTEDTALSKLATVTKDAALNELKTGTKVAALNELETGTKDAALNELETGTKDAALNELETGTKDAALNELETGTKDAALNELETGTRDAALNELETGTRDATMTKPANGDVALTEIKAGSQIAPIVIENEDPVPELKNASPTVIHEDPNDVSMEDMTGDDTRSTSSISASQPTVTEAQSSRNREKSPVSQSGTAPSVSTSVVKPIVATHSVKPQVTSRPQTVTVVPEKGSETQATPSAGTSAGSNANSMPSVDDLGTLFNVNGLDLSKYTEKISVAVRETMMGMCEDMISTGIGSTFRNHLQLEAQRLQWRHRQEISEIRHTINLKLLEIRASMELEKDKAVDKVMHDLHTKFELEKQQAIEETKKKQWCAGCGKEAIFYCCWNTSYCDYPCQQAHWPKHMSSCTQTQASQPPPDQGTDHTQASSGSVSKGVSLEPFAPMGNHGNQGVNDYNKSPYQHSPTVRQISPIVSSYMKQPISQLQLMRPNTRPRMVQYIQPQPSQMYRQPHGGAQFQYGGHGNMHQPPVLMVTTSTVHHPNASPHQSHLGLTTPGPMGTPSQSILLTHGARMPSNVMPGASPYRHNNF